MKALSPIAQNLFDRARDVGTPDAAARSRVEHALLERIASGAATSAVLGKTGAAGASATAAKGVLVVGLAGAALWGGLTLSTRGDVESISEQRRGAASGSTQEPVVTVAPSERRSEVPGTPASSSRVERSEPGKPDVLAVKVRPERSALPPRAQGLVGERSARHAGAAGASGETSPSQTSSSRLSIAPERTDATPTVADAAPIPTPSSDSLAEEASGLRAIQRALRAGDGARALELVSKDNTRFVGGILHQERAAARIQALCLLGRTVSARSETESFERRWPRSPLVPRLRASCR